MTLVKPFAAFGMAACLAVACGGHVVSPVAHLSPKPFGPIASNLPTGVCAPTYERVRDPNATRVEAKLVTPGTLSKSDPDWNNGYHIPSAYYWVISKAGTFYLTGIPRPEAPSGSPMPYHVEISYLKANPDPSDPEDRAQPCRAIEFQATDGPWPTWFDQMSAVDDVKVQ